MSDQRKNPYLANVPDHIKARIRGPYEANGMTYWTVHKLLPNGATGEQLGGPCFTWDQACERADDVANRRVMFALGRPWKVREPENKEGE